jgi:bZIP transcription factor/Minimal binding motif of Hap4 for binding to Hap2/3/5
MVKTLSKLSSPSAITAAEILQNGHPSAPSKFAIAPATSGSNVVPPTPTSLTSKEWIVPPRPKPGRKPATDTPPTKRKAQNRAAQRAFRERRAARVGELEEELKKIEKEDEDEQNALRDQIEELEKNVEEYRTSLNFWMQRCRGLEAELAVESAAKEAHQSPKETPIGLLQSSSSVDHQSQSEALQEDATLGCGNCSSITNCRCIQEVLNMPSVDSSSNVQGTSCNKRLHSPSCDHPTSKRIKPEPANELETDFTTSFSIQQPGNTNRGDHVSPSSSSAVADPCGFCNDGTVCICAEMQAEEANNRNTTSHMLSHHNHPGSQPGVESVPPSSSLLPRISQLSHITPPPSDTDVSIPISSTLHPNSLSSSSSSSSSSNPCINGPGTCLQCRSDPNSTLFCKSLAKSRELQQQQHHPTPSTSASSTQTACCSTNTQSSSACCRSSQPPPGTNAPRGPTTRARTTNTEHTPETNSAVTISCADAYTTLSRHPGYEKAMARGEMGRWLPKLHPTSCISTSTSTSDDNRNTRNATGEHEVESQGRPAMEIDAANVMAVLRDFDRRFI